MVYWTGILGKVAEAAGVAAARRAVKTYKAKNGWQFGGKGRSQWISAYKPSNGTYRKKNNQKMPSYSYSSRKRKRTGGYKRKGKYRKTGYYGRYNGSPGRERKFHDLDINGTIGATGSIIEDSCVVIAQGTGESERIGRKCTVKSIDWNYTLTLPTTTVFAEGDDVARMILYVDTQTNGVTATVAAPAGLLVTSNFQSHYEMQNIGRFRILWDKTFNINVTAGGGDGTIGDSYSRAISGNYHKNVNIPIEYSSTTGAITEQRSNNIGVLVISKRGDIGLDSNMRIVFTG